jgi:hypothetical protein
MLNSFSCAGLRLSIHHAPKAAVWDEKWTLKQVGNYPLCIRD